MRLNWNMLSRYRSQIYAFSILWIFVFHALGEDAKVEIFHRIPSYIIDAGNLGVDAFLFMSGISLYFAMTKTASVRAFYARRFSKILKIYFVFCIPYFIYRYLIGGMGVKELVRQIAFANPHVSSFWFLLCIMICYLIYPAIYRLIRGGKKKLILAGIVVYVLALGCLNHFCQGVFLYDEVLTTRIPVFLAGCLAGQYVYEKKEIRPGVLFVMLAGILGKDVVKYLIQWIPAFEYHKKIVNRLYGGVIAVGVIFLVVILVPYLKDTLLDRWLSYLGTITLEVYVIHIALRHILKGIPFFTLKTKRGCVVYTIALFIITLIAAALLHKGLEKIGPGNHNKRKEGTGKNG